MNRQPDMRQIMQQAQKMQEQLAKAQAELADTALLADMKMEDFDAVFYPGGLIGLFRKVFARGADA